MGMGGKVAPAGSRRDSWYNASQSRLPTRIPQSRPKAPPHSESKRRGSALSDSPSESKVSMSSADPVPTYPTPYTLGSTRQ